MEDREFVERFRTVYNCFQKFWGEENNVLGCHQCPYLQCCKLLDKIWDQGHSAGLRDAMEVEA